MKKSKIFLTAGALVLAITAVFASKVNKKFFTGVTLYAGSNVYHFVLPFTPILTTKSNATGAEAIYATVSNGTNKVLGGTVQLENSLGKKVFFK